MSNIITCTMDRLARFLGVKLDAVEDAITSERAARQVLSRRGLLAGVGALATGAAFSFPAPTPSGAVWMLNATASYGKSKLDTVIIMTRWIKGQSLISISEGL